jgi:hypothetical protein
MGSSFFRQWAWPWLIAGLCCSLCHPNPPETQGTTPHARICSAPHASRAAPPRSRPPSGSVKYEMGSERRWAGRWGGGGLALSGGRCCAGGREGWRGGGRTGAATHGHRARPRGPGATCRPARGRREPTIGDEEAIPPGRGGGGVGGGGGGVGGGGVGGGGWGGGGGRGGEGGGGGAVGWEGGGVGCVGGGGEGGGGWGGGGGVGGGVGSGVRLSGSQSRTEKTQGGVGAYGGFRRRWEEGRAGG